MTIPKDLMQHPLFAPLMQQLQATPAFDLYKALIPAAEVTKLMQVVQGIMSDKLEVPFLNEQRLPWLARGAQVVPFCRSALMAKSKESYERMLARASMSESEALEDIKKQIREENLYPRRDMTDAEKEAYIQEMAPLNQSVEPLLLPLQKAFFAGLPTATGSITLQIQQLVDFGVKTSLQLMDFFEQIIPKVATSPLVRFMPAEAAEGFKLFMTFGPLFLPKIKKIAEEKAATIQAVSRFVLGLEARAAADAAPAPASASASSSSQAAAAPQAEMPYIARFLRAFADMLNQIEKLPAAGSQVDTAAVERVKDEVEVTLKDVDLSFKQLEAMGKACKNLKKLTLGENVTLAGSKHFDKEAVEFFFAEVEVVGAPCASMAGHVKELMGYSEALGVSQEQLWNYTISLHKEAHAAHADLHEPSHQTWVDGETTKLKQSGRDALVPFVESIISQF